MKGEELDDLIDNLPWHLKTKVLTYGEEGAQLVEALTYKPSRANWKANTTRIERLAWWLAIPIVYSWALVVFVVGLLCLIIPPLGLAVITAAGMPGMLHIAWRTSRSMPDIDDQK
jgi:hypothetical protein